jgi:hypothetical protein
MDPDFEIFIQRMLTLGQQALDSADPLNFAGRWRADPPPGFAPRRVLIQEGIGDELVSNASTEALAAAGDLPAQTPQNNVDGVSGLWRFDPPGGHGIFGRADVRCAQAAEFRQRRHGDRRAARAPHGAVARSPFNVARPGLSFAVYELDRWPEPRNEDRRGPGRYGSAAHPGHSRRCSSASPCYRSSFRHLWEHPLAPAVLSAVCAIPAILDAALSGGLGEIGEGLGNTLPSSR